MPGTWKSDILASVMGLPHFIPVSNEPGICEAHLSGLLPRGSNTSLYTAFETDAPLLAAGCLTHFKAGVGAALLLITVCRSNIDSFSFLAMDLSGIGNKGMEEDCGTGRSKGYSAGHFELLEKE